MKVYYEIRQKSRRENLLTIIRGPNQAPGVSIGGSQIRQRRLGCIGWIGQSQVKPDFERWGKSTLQSNFRMIFVSQSILREALVGLIRIIIDMCKMRAVGKR